MKRTRELLNTLIIKRHVNIIKDYINNGEYRKKKDQYLLVYICALPGDNIEIIRSIMAMFPGINAHWRDELAFRQACRQGNAKIAKYLAEYDGFLPTDIAIANNCAFRHACAMGHLAIAQYLYKKYLDQININAMDDYAFRHAAANGHINVINWLLSNSKIFIAALDNYALRKAYYARNATMIDYLIGLYQHTDELIVNKEKFVTETFYIASIRGWFKTICWIYERHPNYNYQQYYTKILNHYIIDNIEYRYDCSNIIKFIIKDKKFQRSMILPSILVPYIMGYFCREYQINNIKLFYNFAYRGQDYNVSDEFERIIDHLVLYPPPPQYIDDFIQVLQILYKYFPTRYINKQLLIYLCGYKMVKALQWYLSKYRHNSRVFLSRKNKMDLLSIINSDEYDINIATILFREQVLNRDFFINKKHMTTDIPTHKSVKLFYKTIYKHYNDHQFLQIFLYDFMGIDYIRQYICLYNYTLNYILKYKNIQFGEYILANSRIFGFTTHNIAHSCRNVPIFIKYIETKYHYPRDHKFLSWYISRCHNFICYSDIHYTLLQKSSDFILRHQDGNKKPSSRYEFYMIIKSDPSFTSPNKYRFYNMGLTPFNEIFLCIRDWTIRNHNISTNKAKYVHNSFKDLFECIRYSQKHYYNLLLMDLTGNKIDKISRYFRIKI